MRPAVRWILVAALLSSCSPETQVRLAAVCIERPEQQGRINIIPVSVSLTSEDDDRTVRLAFPTGGSRACAELPAGRTTATLRFPYPYGGAGEPPRYWQTRSVYSLPPASVPLVLDTSNAFDPQAPGWDETGWHDMWELRPAG